ncbi:MAG: Nramp family divalent metal transporter [Anaerolineaceae bacterium]|nr:Nramp family divalent metal transporter [Anaerolineaceae bacterium]
MRKKIKTPIWLARILAIFAIVGPGLITASADNDAPGIATYSMAGSRYGYGFLWVIIAITIGEVVIQEMAARMGAVTGKGTADLIRERFGVKITTFAMFCLLIANLGTTIAEFAGIAAVGELFGISRFLTVPLGGLLITMLVLKGGYDKVEKVMLFLCLSALAYVATVFIIKPDWGEIGRQAISPQIQFNKDYIINILAVIGTTITPWGIFYLQASVADKGIDMDKYGHTKIDVGFGAAWGNVISAFIIITTAATLFYKGIVVTNATEAALALEPLAGHASKLLFALGLLGASLLSISVLPLATTYAMCEAFGFERGLNRPVKEAPAFYTTFSIITVLSILSILFIPSQSLFQFMMYSQSLNGILLPILLVLVLILANSKDIMGKWINKTFQNVLAVAMTVMIFGITVILFIEPLLP